MGRCAWRRSPRAFQLHWQGCVPCLVPEVFLLLLLLFFGADAGLPEANLKYSPPHRTLPFPHMFLCGDAGSQASGSINAPAFPYTLPKPPHHVAGQEALPRQEVDRGPPAHMDGHSMFDILLPGRLPHELHARRPGQRHCVHGPQHRQLDQVVGSGHLQLLQHLHQ